MTKIEGALKALTSGVSQQSEALRGPGHLQEMVNYMPDLIEGSRSRPGTEFQHRHITPTTNHLRNNTWQGAVVGTPGTPPTHWTVDGDSGGVARAITALSVDTASIDFVRVRWFGDGAVTKVARMEALNAVVAAPGEEWTASCYVRLGAGTLTGISNIVLFVWALDSGGSVIGSTNTSHAPTTAVLSGQRPQATLTMPANTAFVTMGVAVVCAATPVDLSLDFGLPQLELRDGATGAIKTFLAARSSFPDATDLAVHFIDKSATERYAVVAGSGFVRVFDVLSGAEKIVHTPDGSLAAYNYALGGASQMRFLSINDYTFIVNRGAVVEENLADVAAALVHDAIIHVRQADSDIGYTVTVVYATVTYTASFGSPDSSNPLKTSVIASGLAAALEAALPGGVGAWTVIPEHNIVYLKRIDGATFTVDARDEASNVSVKAIKDTVEKFSDLPNHALAGFVTEVLGDPTIKEDNFWVAFVTDIPGVGLGKGHWIEVTKPGVTLSFNPSTMVHILTRDTDGHFTFKEAAWGKRVVGDAERSPMPSFVGRSIDHMTATQGRLFISAGDNEIASRSADLFHFFRQTATALIDDDPIDINALFPKEIKLKAAAPWLDKVLLFASNAQFLLKGGAMLVPKTASMDLVGSFACYPEGGVAAGDDRVFVPFMRTEETASGGINSTGIVQFATPVGVSDKLVEGTDITEHVPTYIKGRVLDMVCSAGAKLLMVRTDDDPTKLYGYRWATNSQGVLNQMAWFTLEFPRREILGMTFVASRLILFTKTENNEGLTEVLECAPKAAYTPFDFIPVMDFLVQPSGPSLVGGDTVFTLPYNLPGVGVTTIALDMSEDNEGNPLTVVSHEGDQLTIDGDHPEVLVGIYFDDEIELPKFFLKRPSQEGGFETIPGDRLSILRIGVGFDKSGPFTVTVQCGQQPERITTMPSTFPQSGTRWLGVGGRNQDTTIRINRNGVTPVRLMYVRWRAKLIQSGRLM